MSLAPKLALAAVLAVAVALSLLASAPRTPTSPRELRRLVLSAVLLYVVGAIASLTHHPGIAAFVYATGIVVSALAAWLSRGTDSEGPPGGEEPEDERPPPEPDGMPRIDWNEFDRAFGAYAASWPARPRPARPRAPAG